MLLRFIAENFTSFKEATEINTFTSSKSKSLMHHRVECDHAEVLRLNAIYGANAAGKSNFVKAFKFLQEWIVKESLRPLWMQGPYAFKLDKDTVNAPSALAVEFFIFNKIYYYQIEFNQEQIYHEELLISGKTKDYPIFTRDEQGIHWEAEDKSNKFNPMIVDAINRMLRPDLPLLAFLGHYYFDLNEDVTNAYTWFVAALKIIEPTSFPVHLPQLLDTDIKFAKLAQDFIRATNSGITSLNVRKEELEDDLNRYDGPMRLAIETAKKNPGEPYTTLTPPNRNIENIIFENGKIIKKALTITHQSAGGKEVEFDYINESDGTHRLIEYLPIIYGLINPNPLVYVIDEIERSIHPVLMKKLLEIISKNKDIKGQLIFTTHESNLLDQNLLRPDEIWFAEKDIEQSTRFYPLSDYRIHHTANIQNGYLDGRYGGIPFVDNLNRFGGNDL